MLTKEQLEQLLREAGDAHHVFEQASGKPDKNWPAWYADFIIKKLEQ